MLQWQPVLNSQETKPACRKPTLLVAESGDQGATVEVAGGFQGRSRECGPGVGAPESPGGSRSARPLSHRCETDRAFFCPVVSSCFYRLSSSHSLGVDQELRP